MQEDFKNQLQNALGIWRKKGQSFVDGMVKEAKDEFRSRLSQQGLTEKWPALINLIEEFWPDLTPPVATIVGQKMDPLAQWLGLKVKNWDPYRMEVLVHPQKHLLGSKAWHTSSIVAMSETAARWLLEKHAPPGDLQALVQKVEVSAPVLGKGDCTVRCELNASEFEEAMAELMKEGKVDFFLPTLILSSQDVLLSQVHFHFEL